ncbi:MAG: stage II sporulation protein D [Firmicutes bacterium]|nr:stage II sporulation protein D [Bacillota bacterium]
MPRKLLGLVMVCLIVASIPALVVSVLESEPLSPPVQIKTSDLMVRVLNVKSGKVETLPLDDYLVGVVAAEMPAVFEPSALAAQAIAARTYTLKRIRQGKSSHPGADLCSDPAHCQAWKGNDELWREWGVLHYAGYHRKIAEAVESTRGLVVTYQGELIDPVYHSTCGGATENSEDVWVYKVPYLRGVACGYCGGAPHYQDEVTVSWDDLYKKLGLSPAVPVASGAGKSKNSGPATIQAFAHSPTGRIKTLVVGQKRFAGTEIRSRLGLASTRFRWQLNSDGVTFYTQGYGHGVGMCQYGAQGLARAGKTPAEILQYYYQGVEIQRMGS